MSCYSVNQRKSLQSPRSIIVPPKGRLNMKLQKQLKLGRGGILGQGKGSGSWVKKWLMGILAHSVLEDTIQPPKKTPHWSQWITLVHIFLGRNS